MRKIKHEYYKILETQEDLIKAIHDYKKNTKGKGATIFFDTETTGLNIRYDTPFLLPWGYYVGDTAYIYCIDIDVNKRLFQQTALTLLRLAKDVGICGHNIKYDLHMLENINIKLPNDLYYRDTQILIRLAHDALTVENGGPPLGLKEYAVKYIDRGAKATEAIVKLNRKDLAKQYNKQLKDAMYKIDRRWTIAYIEDYFKDVLHSVDTLDANVKEAYLSWYNSLPEKIRTNMTTGKVDSDDIPYYMLDRASTTEYAMHDILWTMEIFLQCIPAIEARDNIEALRREEVMIMPLVRM